MYKDKKMAKINIELLRDKKNYYSVLFQITILIKKIASESIKS
jgi:hypothetical protein